MNLILEDISNEIDIHFEGIEELYYNESSSDSIPVFFIKWSNNLNEEIIINQEKKLKKV